MSLNRVPFVIYIVIFVSMAYFATVDVYTPLQRGTFLHKGFTTLAGSLL
jgi:hypothetical protein